ncbi:MAG TPA: thiamine-phosphate kinase, partial [Acidimicrobiales bacterium]|nr:thiamine-phosphate kinase [Acidimicrobiales bacterium]
MPARRVLGGIGAQQTPEREGASKIGAGGERQALVRLRQLMPLPPPGEVWAGDDAAVVHVPTSPGLLLLASDCLVAGLDADLGLTTLADLGWKAMAVNLSDIAAMGGRPLHAVVSVVGLNVRQLEEVYTGLLSAAGHYSCPVVGGDLSSGPEGVVSVAVTGWVDGPPVLRSGAQAGDAIWVTGLLG